MSDIDTEIRIAAEVLHKAVINYRDASSDDAEKYNYNTLGVMLSYLRLKHETRWLKNERPKTE